MRRVHPEDVVRRYRETGLSPCADDLGVEECGGVFVAKYPTLGVCGLGVMVIGLPVPPGISAMQVAVNSVLDITFAYGWGFYDGFAGWEQPFILDDADPDTLAEYTVGQHDGRTAWARCDPVANARQACFGASELLKRRGWTRGRLEHMGKFAVDGALRMVLWGSTRPNPESMTYQLAVRMIESFLSQRHNMKSITVPWWNDNVCTGLREAVEVLEAISRGER